MSKEYRVSEDLVIRILDGKFVLTNVFARSHFEVTTETLKLLSLLDAQPKTADEISSIIGRTIDKYSLVPRTYFSLEKGLVTNPDNLAGSPCGKEVVFESAKSLVDYLEKNLIIYSDRKAYTDSFNLKRSFLDSRRIGNFHQQISRFAMTGLKKTIDDWWVEQKFLDDRSGLKDTAYKFVQEKFIRSYFTKERIAGRSILDIGCGIGYYDRILAENGAKVLGIDPNEKYIECARKHYSHPNLEFRVVNMDTEGLNSIKKESFDAIFISDSLLFYFVAPDPKNPPKDVAEFLKEVKDVLKPSGNLYLLEPHGVFFLQSWFGSAERPYTVMAEYNDRFFRVVPTLEELAGAVSKSGFLIKEIKEPIADRGAAKDNPKTANFCSRFPIWWFFNLVKA